MPQAPPETSLQAAVGLSKDPYQNQKNIEGWIKVVKHAVGLPKRIKETFDRAWTQDYGPITEMNTGKDIARQQLKDAFEIAGYGVVGGAPGGYFGGAAADRVVGQIKYTSKPIAKALRKVMQQEAKLRGPRPEKMFTPKGSSIETQYGYKMDVSHLVPESESVASDVLRGTFYRGQRTIPRPLLTKGNKLAHKARGKVHEGPPTARHTLLNETNVGEPMGISLTTDPATAKAFTKKELMDSSAQWQKRVEAEFSVDPAALEASKAKTKELFKKINAFHNEGEEAPQELMQQYTASLDDHIKLEKSLPTKDQSVIGRVAPLYGGPPEEKIIKAWTREGGEAMKSAYKKAVKELSEEFPALKDVGGISELKAELSNKVTKFNTLLTENLMKEGYEGILYSPQRFDEFELKMFDPDRVLFLDERVANLDPGIDKAFPMHNRHNTNQTTKHLKGMSGKVSREWAESTQGEPAHLYDWYRELTREELGIKAPAPRPEPTAEDAFEAAQASGLSHEDILKIIKKVKDKGS